MNWAFKTTSFSTLDRFVVENKSQHEWLKQIHSDIRSQFKNAITHKPYIIKRRFGNWRDRVVDWYNNWVQNGFKNTKKHLFLYGPSDTGKTSFISYLMGNLIV